MIKHLCNGWPYFGSVCRWHNRHNNISDTTNRCSARVEIDACERHQSIISIEISKRVDILFYSMANKESVRYHQKHEAASGDDVVIFTLRKVVMKMSNLFS